MRSDVMGDFHEPCGAPGGLEVEPGSFMWPSYHCPRPIPTAESEGWQRVAACPRRGIGYSPGKRSIRSSMSDPLKLDSPEDTDIDAGWDDLDAGPAPRKRDKAKPPRKTAE